MPQLGAARPPSLGNGWEASGSAAGIPATAGRVSRISGDAEEDPWADGLMQAAVVVLVLLAGAPAVRAQEDDREVPPERLTVEELNRRAHESTDPGTLSRPGKPRST